MCIAIRRTHDGLLHKHRIIPPICAHSQPTAYIVSVQIHKTRSDGKSAAAICGSLKRKQNFFPENLENHIFVLKDMYVYRLDLLESGLFICGNSKANEENMMTGFECICCWALLLFVIVVMCIVLYTCGGFFAIMTICFSCSGS